MAELVLIQGKSGVGKSHSLKHLEPDNTMLIQSRNKRLPFRSDGWNKWDKESKTGSILKAESMSQIYPLVSGLAKHGKKVFVIDDFQYFFASSVFGEIETKGFEKWSILAKTFWDTMTNIQDEVDEDVRVYIITHTDEQDGFTKMKTAGKLIDNTITPEGLFTMVIGAEKDSDGNYFTAINNGRNTLKAPEGLFDDREPNDIAVIDNKICQFYNIK